MTRKFLDDVNTEIDTLFLNNAAGEISPADLRLVCKDIIDSCINDEGIISTTSVQTGVATTSTLTALDVFDTEIGGDNEFIKLDAATGTITCAAIAGFSYGIRAQLELIAGNQEVFSIAILVDGVQVGASGAMTSQGPGDPVSAFVEALVLSMGADAVVQLGIESQNAVDTFDLQTASIQVEIKPTRNP